MMSGEDRDIILNEIRAMRSDLEEVRNQIKTMNAKLDGNTVEMNERFAAVEERFVKSEAIMESTKDQIGLVENNLNIKIVSVKDEVSADIKTQIGEARSEFHDVITTTNERIRMASDKML